MGRKPTHPNAIPRLRVRRKGKRARYYYDTGGKPRREIPLGSDYGLAIKKWAELEGDREAPVVRQAITFRYVADEYRRLVIPTKAPRTQHDNLIELGRLLEFFDDPPGPLEAIEPQHVRQYMTWRNAPVRAKREKALLSHLWNWARERGYTALANPCAGIKGKKERGRRDVYVHDDAYKAVQAAASVGLAEAMDLLYLSGQRPADVVRMDETHIRGGALDIRQGKTGAGVRLSIEGELAALIERIKARKRACAIYSTRLVVDAQGRPFSLPLLERHFQRARKAAGIAPASFQLRDLRAKAGTDKNDSAGDIRQAQAQLGHASVVMTEAYIRNRRGGKTTPTR